MTANRVERGNTWRMRVKIPGRLEGFAAGQFVMLRLGGGDGRLYLNRPFSPFDVRLRGPATFMDILYRIVGRGTAYMSTLRVGARFGLLAILGRGFTPMDAARHFIVGGGIGAAPLHVLARDLLHHGIARRRIRVFLGGRSVHDILGEKDFRRLGVPVTVATDDGTMGAKGLVTQPVLARLNMTSLSTALYACGPTPMLRAISNLAHERDLSCQLSLEQVMGCGVGVCFSCVAAIAGDGEAWHFHRTCLDGPVVDGRSLVWDPRL